MDVPPFVRRVPLDLLENEARILYKAAMSASQNALVKISGLAVGAALSTQEGKVFMGCNVESDAFSPTSCAEVVACDKAISEGYMNFSSLALFSHDREEKGRDSQPISPCGRCRQKLLEVSDMEVIMTARNCSEAWVCLLSTLLPLPFRL
jgi:cytidine deaminase